MSLEGISKDLKKFPGILDYLELYYPKVYQTIADLGLYAPFIPKRGIGRTFLLPDDKYLKAMRDIIKSENPEEATDMMGSLIIMDYLPTSKEWELHKEDIGNSLGRVIEIKNITPEVITLANGSKLTPDTNYKPFARQGTMIRGNTAIWFLDGKVDYSEKVPLSTGKFRTKKTTGGNDTQNNDRLKLAKTLEENFIKFVNGEIGDPYVNVIAAFIGFANDKQVLSDLLRIIMSNCCPHAAFYSLFEPYKARNHFLVSDSEVKEFCDYCDYGNFSPDMAVQTINNFCNTLPQSNDIAIYNDDSRNRLQKEINDIRNKMLNNPGLVRTTTQIGQIYEKLSRENQIGNVKNIFPHEAFERITKEEYRLAAIQENAFINELLIAKILSMMKMNPEEAKKNFLIFIDCISTRQSADYKSQFTMGNSEYAQKKSFDAAWFASGPCLFLRSSEFLAIPEPSKKIIGSNEFDEDSLHPFSNKRVNLRQRNINLLSKYGPNKKFELSKRTKRELEIYQNIYGHLPKKL